MPRRMRDLGYRAEQWRDRYAPHVEPINRLVDELSTHDAADRPPYVAPMYRGVHAPALAILRDPGPKAGGVQGSGFLSMENDDQTAERQCRFFAEAGLDPADVVPWNAGSCRPTTRAGRRFNTRIRRSEHGERTKSVRPCAGLRSWSAPVHLR